jgi:hypothetical protein
MTTPHLIEDHEALLDYATRVRPDIDRRDLEGAVLALKAAPWSWTRITSAVHLMLVRGEDPQDLRNALRDPVQTRRTALDRTA